MTVFLLVPLRDGRRRYARGTPADVIKLLNREINAAFEDPPIKQRFAITGSAGRFGEMIAAGIARWRKVVELSGQRKE